MFFGVGLIYTDLLELQPVGQADDTSSPAPVAPPVTVAALATARPSRSPFALLIFAAALLMTLDDGAGGGGRRAGAVLPFPTGIPSRRPALGRRRCPRPRAVREGAQGAQGRGERVRVLASE